MLEDRFGRLSRLDTLPPDYVDSEAAFQYFSLVKELIFSLENLHRPIQAMQSQVLIHRKALLILVLLLPRG
jgi:hypothetical protein